MALDIEAGIRLILQAQEKERDERIFRQWVAQLPIMAVADNVVSFDDYRDRVTGANIDFRPAADILEELDEVEKQFEKGGGNNGA